MSNISRSEYQKVCEENKRMKADLKIICFDKPSPEKILLIFKWKNHFYKEELLYLELKKLATHLKLTK